MMRKTSMSGEDSMWTDDQKKYLSDQLRIHTTTIISELTKIIKECETTRCCKGTDFKCLATKEDLSLQNFKFTAKLVGLIIVTMFFVQELGGPTKVLIGWAAKMTATEQLQH
jgi:hypothetical protein